MLAGRGLQIEPYPRVEVLEIETDPVQLELDDGELQLRSPLRAALRFEVTEADLNAALRSSEVLEKFQDIEAQLPVFGNGDDPEVFDLENPSVELLGQNRLRLNARLVVENNDGADGILEVEFTSRVLLEAEQRVVLVEPKMTLNEESVPEEIADAFASGISRALDVSDLAERNIVIRLLDLKVSDDVLSAVGFIQLETLEFDSRSTLPPISTPPGSLE